MKKRKGRQCRSHYHRVRHQSTISEWVTQSQSGSPDLKVGRHITRWVTHSRSWSLNLRVGPSNWKSHFINIHKTMFPSIFFSTHCMCNDLFFNYFNNPIKYKLKIGTHKQQQIALRILLWKKIMAFNVSVLNASDQTTSGTLCFVVCGNWKIIKEKIKAS